MSFWTGGDSPASTSAPSNAETSNGGRRFFFGSEDELDGDAAYGLFDSESAGAAGGAGAGSSSSALGLTSMDDFWRMEGIASGPSPAGADQSQRPQTAGAMFVKQEEMDNNDDVYQRMLAVAGQQQPQSSTARSPEGMAFEDFITADSFAPATSYSSSNASSIQAGPASSAFARPTMQSAFDTSSLFQDMPASAFGSPGPASGSSLPLHGVLRTHLSNNDQNASQTVASSAIFSPPMSPQSLLQQLSSSNSDPNSGSSRSSSANPPNRSHLPSKSGAVDSASSEDEHTANIPVVQQPPRSQSSASLRNMASNAYASTSGSPMKTSKSATSLASSAGIRISSTSSSTPKEVHSTTSLTTLADKSPVAAPCESATLLKTVARDEKAKQTQAQLVILGLPDEGARSRVETQVKVGISLVRPKTRLPNVPSILNYRNAKGGLTPEADQYFERVGTWRYLSLPTVSAVKRKAKKHYRTDLPPEDTLFADIKVVSATEPSREIYICSNCQQREFKRLQRKTQNRSKPSQDVDSGKEDEKGFTDEQLAKRKVVLFNCGKYLDFHNGEVVVPTRITCYCRHHKEKYGFTIVYTLTDHTGRVVANATSPAIFLTDDHKARPTKPEGAAAGAVPSLASVANGPYASGSARNSAWTSTAGSLQSSAASSQVGSAASSANPSRNNSFENLEELGHNANTSGSSTNSHGRPKRDRTAKPYSMDARPAKPKRTNSMNRLNSFAMTPLNMSAPASPKMATKSPLAPMTALPPDYLSQANGPLQNFADMLNNTGLPDTHPSPGSSLSAPSTPGASLESFGSSYPQAAFFGQGSTTSLSDDHKSTGSQSVEQSPAYGGFVLPLPGQGSNSNSLAQHLASLEMNAPSIQAPMPKISRLIPAEGPVHGGIEVIILGENFSPGLEVMFGDVPAVSTQAWGANTIMCVLPPSPSPGPVVVGFKNLQMHMSGSAGLQLFTYLDTSDKALMELALQVVGMKMTGRIDDARNVARRIIAGNGAGTEGTGISQISPGSSQGGFGQSTLQMSKSSLALHDQLTSLGEEGPVKDYQTAVLKLLSLLDVELDEQDGSAAPQIAINHANEQRHTLLHLATMLGFQTLVSFLIDRNVDLDVSDKNGYTALHLAALRGRVAVTRLLLHAGAELDCRTLAGETALEIACSRDQLDVAELYPQRRRSPVPSRRASSSHGTPRRRTSPFRLQSARRKKLFSLSPRDSEDDASSDWSSEEDACFASESDLEGQLSSVSSAVSLSMSRSPARSRAQSVLHARASDAEESDDCEREGGLPSCSDNEAQDAAGQGFGSRLFSRIFGQTSPGQRPQVSLSSPSAQSLSLSSATGSSLDRSQEDSDAEEAEDWPRSALFGGSSQGSADRAAKGMRASLSRRLGYPLEHLAEDAMRSYSYHANKYGRLGRDRMLYFFWLPLFFIALFWTFHQASHAINTTLLGMQKAAKTKLHV